MKFNLSLDFILSCGTIKENYFVILKGRKNMYDRWSLDVLYSGFEDEKFQNDLKNLDELIENQIAFAASLGEKDARTTAKEALTNIETFRETFFSLIEYCSLRQSADTNDGDAVSYYGRIVQKYNNVAKASVAIDKYPGT